MKMRPSRFPVAWFFILLFALQLMNSGIVLPFPASRVSSALWRYLASPSLLGLLMILWLQGVPGIQRVLYKLTPWAAGRAWPMLAVCVLLPLACLPVAIVLYASCGDPVPSLSSINLPAYFYAAFIGKGLLGNGLYEEIGWRGFALPYLQRCHSALASSLMIGLVWAPLALSRFRRPKPLPMEICGAVHSASHGNCRSSSRGLTIQPMEICLWGSCCTEPSTRDNFWRIGASSLTRQRRK